MNDAAPDHPMPRRTWVVLCISAGIPPFPVYVEGTALECPGHGQEILVRDGGTEVRRFAAGSWLNYAEWVTTPNWFSAATTAYAKSIRPGS